MDTCGLGFSISILDCYTDPLGWKNPVKGPLDTKIFSLKDPIEAVLFRHVRNLDLLFSTIMEMGEGILYSCYPRERILLLVF